MLNIVKSLLFEYGAGWAANRFLYSAKLKLLNTLPASALLFEKTVNVKKFDIFSLDVTALEGFLRALPQEKRKFIIETADATISGKIAAFESLYLEYGSPIDWQLNPITGKRADIEKKWYSIPDFDAQRGDIKIIWEPSRLTHFFSFARAYLITGEKKYYEAFSSQLEHWLNANPYPFGANFKCGQECALRMINVLITASVFADLLTEKDRGNIISLVGVCYKKIRSNFFYAYKCIKNNHTLSEITGLIIGAWCCYDENRLRKAYRLLEEEIPKQFTRDGGYVQHSFNYQRFALQLMEAVFKISETTGIRLSSGARSILENSVLLLYQMQQDNGHLPNYGSNDGALIFPLSVCDYRDYRPCLNTLHQLLTGSRLYSGGDYDEELYWFGNPIAPIARVGRESKAFSGAGLYSLRTESVFVLLVCQNYKSRPAHFDQLHLDLWYNGINIFCDSGTYSYASELGASLTATSGHNTIIADGREQMNKKGSFLIYNWTKRIDAKLEDNTFRGAFRSLSGYTHTRTVKVDDDFCEITDEATGAIITERLFHTPCEIEFTNNGFYLLNDGVRICQVQCSGDISVDKSKRSCYYMKCEYINLIRIMTPAQDMQKIKIYFI